MIFDEKYTDQEKRNCEKRIFVKVLIIYLYRTWMKGEEIIVQISQGKKIGVKFINIDSRFILKDACRQNVGIKL
jgi:hypothetical protein